MLHNSTEQDSVNERGVNERALPSCSTCSDDTSGASRSPSTVPPPPAAGTTGTSTHSSTTRSTSSSTRNASLRTVVTNILRPFRNSLRLPSRLRRSRRRHTSSLPSTSPVPSRTPSPSPIPPPPQDTEQRVPCQSLQHPRQHPASTSSVTAGASSATNDNNTTPLPPSIYSDLSPSPQHLPYHTLSAYASNKTGKKQNNKNPLSTMMRKFRGDRPKPKPQPPSGATLIPLDPSPPTPSRAPLNGGNTCYLDSVLVALFADYDGWDGLLTTSSSQCPPSFAPSTTITTNKDQHNNFLTTERHLQTKLPSNYSTKNRSGHVPSSTTTNPNLSSTANPSASTSDSHPSATLVWQLRTIANKLRSGVVVEGSELDELRSTLIAQIGWPNGRGQHDAAELLASLLDALKAPFVSLVNNLSHHGTPDDGADHVPFTERVIWLGVNGLKVAPSSSLFSFGSSQPVKLEQLINNYFFCEVLTGLRRERARSSVLTNVDATVSRSLIPAYTPVRETGESSNCMASRHTFSFLTVPFALRRFTGHGLHKDQTPVHVPTAINATKYVGPFANGVTHTLILRSVICHLGADIQSGHYVAYTYAPSSGGWRRWDDLDDAPVRAVSGDPRTGEPVNKKWAEEIRTGAYLMFYELLPGDSIEDARAEAKEIGKKTVPSNDEMAALDMLFAAQAQEEEAKTAGLRDPPAHFVLAGGGGRNLNGGSAMEQLKRRTHSNSGYQQQRDTPSRRQRHVNKLGSEHIRSPSSTADPRNRQGATSFDNPRRPAQNQQQHRRRRMSSSRCDDRLGRRHEREQNRE